MVLQPNEMRSRQLKYAHLEKIGVSALQQCGIFDSSLSFISDTGNVIFRSDTIDQSYCVRVYQEILRSTPEIYGELFWLLDLQKNTDIIVPYPLKTASGNHVQEITALDGSRKFQVVIFKWITGEVIGSKLDKETAKQLGVLMAKLHKHAENFSLPKDSFRENTDWKGMGHLLAGLTSTQISRIKSFLEKDQLTICNEAAKKAASAINEIDTQHNFGIIHSDLHANNCLSHNGKIGIIDFDDCQFAPFSCDIAITISGFDDFPNHKMLCEAFLEGYSENHKLPQNHVREIESFVTERKLRLLRWISTWQNVDYFPFGRQIIKNSLLHFEKYIKA